MTTYINIHNQKEFDNRPRDNHLRILGNIRITQDDIDAGLNVSTWDMSKCTNMDYMFYNPYIVPGGIRYWDVSACRSMVKMFMKCHNIPDISGWDVSSCINMQNMFMGCPNVPDISGWDISRYCIISGIFHGCKKIPNLTKWDVVKNINKYKFNYFLPYHSPLSFAFAQCKETAQFPNWKIAGWHPELFWDCYYLNTPILLRSKKSVSNNCHSLKL